MIKIGVIGTGGMGHTHGRAYTDMRGVKLIAACDVHEEAAKRFAKTFKVPQVYTSVDEMLANADIEAVSVVTPDGEHAPVSLAAVRAGKHVLCEKPLATSYPDAHKMAQAAKRKGVNNMVNFSYRNAAAIHRARRLIEEGAIGRPIHVHAAYLQSWLSSNSWGDWRKTPAFKWRLSTRHGSKGVLGDVGVHLLDFALYPVGPAAQVRCTLKTFPKHPGNRLGEYVLDANDSALMEIEFKNGALGTLHSTRWATGHANTVAVDVYGDEGGVRINLDQSATELQLCRGKDRHKNAWKTIRCAPTPDLFHRFIKSIRTGENDQPDFARGAEIQNVIDACFESNATGSHIRV
jgi:predicted dehydrogenase